RRPKEPQAAKVRLAVLSAVSVPVLPGAGWRPGAARAAARAGAALRPACCCGALAAADDRRWPGVLVAPACRPPRWSGRSGGSADPLFELTQFCEIGFNRSALSGFALAAQEGLLAPALGAQALLFPAAQVVLLFFERGKRHGGLFPARLLCLALRVELGHAGI